MSAAETYHRPVNTIMVTVNTDTEIVMGGTPEPAYLLTITALPTEIAAARNMRSAHLTQTFLDRSLGIPQDRGVIKFHAINDQDLATNGMTVTEEIEKAERESGDEKRGFSLRSRQSNRPSKRSQLPTTSEAEGEMHNSRSDTPILSQKIDEDDARASTQVTSSGGRVRTRKSIMSFFKR